MEVHKAEHKLYYDLDSYGHNGPLQIVYTKEHSPSHQHWHETLHNLGVDTNRSHMSGSNVGVWTNLAAVNPKTVTRAYSASAYYLPHAGRKNLVLLTEASAREITLQQDGEEWVAKGVRFECNGQELVARASREVIVSAGSVLSPQLLELSGIGNCSVLEAAGVAVKVNNPNVGENLQEHMSESSEAI